MPSLSMLGLTVAMGFSFAGIIGTLYKLVTQRHPSFSIRANRWFVSLARLVLMILSGPFILMRNAIRGRVIEGRPLIWMAGSGIIAACWSLALGISVRDSLIALGVLY